MKVSSDLYEYYVVPLQEYKRALCLKKNSKCSMISFIMVLQDSIFTVYREKEEL